MTLHKRDGQAMSGLGNRNTSGTSFERIPEVAAVHTERAERLSQLGTHAEGRVRMLSGATDPERGTDGRDAVREADTARMRAGAGRAGHVLTAGQGESWEKSGRRFAW